MEKSKIYTRKGDDGTTSLVGGVRVPKTDIRIEAYGTVDELNASIACLLEEIDTREDSAFLTKIQSDLFTLGSYLASEAGFDSCLIDEAAIARVEREIDLIDADLPPIRFFILPGGCRANALANVCRTVCRRAERAVYQLHTNKPLAPEALKYINRLSDYFFLLGRKINFLKNINEKKWEKPC